MREAGWGARLGNRGGHGGKWPRRAHQMPPRIFEGNHCGLCVRAEFYEPGFLDLCELNSGQAASC